MLKIPFQIYRARRISEFSKTIIFVAALEKSNFSLKISFVLHLF